MIKFKGFITLLIGIAILSGCNTPKSKDIDLEVITNTPPTSETDFQKENISKEESIPVIPPDLSTEEGVIEYLKGEWFYDHYYRGDVTCKMSIDKDLNVSLSFENSYSDEPKGNYTGKIKFDSSYANMKEAPDILSIELTDTDDPGGDFFFLHRTIYDEKCIMSWFFAGNGNSIFDVADFTGDYKSTDEEIIFEKITGEKSLLHPRKNDEFYAVYWGKGADENSLWLDDVWWTPPEEDDIYSFYPSKMNFYENDVSESILYNIVPEEVLDILGEELTEGEVYFLKTNENGDITHFISAERHKFLESSSYESVDPEIEDLVFDIIMNDIVEVQEYLESGMSILFTGEMSKIDGEDCYDVILGTDNADHFVQEIFYAVNINTRQVYRYDAITDKWETVPVD